MLTCSALRFDFAGKAGDIVAIGDDIAWLQDDLGEVKGLDLRSGETIARITSLPAESLKFLARGRHLVVTQPRRTTLYRDGIEVWSWDAPRDLARPSRFPSGAAFYGDDRLLLGLAHPAELLALGLETGEIVERIEVGSHGFSDILLDGESVVVWTAEVTALSGGPLTRRWSVPDAAIKGGSDEGLFVVDGTVWAAREGRTRAEGAGTRFTPMNLASGEVGKSVFVAGATDRIFATRTFLLRVGRSPADVVALDSGGVNAVHPCDYFVGAATDDMVIGHDFGAIMVARRTGERIVFAETAAPPELRELFVSSDGMKLVFRSERSVFVLRIADLPAEGAADLEVVPQTASEPADSAVVSYVGAISATLEHPSLRRITLVGKDVAGLAIGERIVLQDYEVSSVGTVKVKAWARAGDHDATPNAGSERALIRWAPRKRLFTADVTREDLTVTLPVWEATHGMAVPPSLRSVAAKAIAEPALADALAEIGLTLTFEPTAAEPEMPVFGHDRNEEPLYAFDRESRAEEPRVLTWNHEEGWLNGPASFDELLEEKLMYAEEQPDTVALIREMLASPQSPRENGAQ